jgi:hypothetical protein
MADRGQDQGTKRDMDPRPRRDKSQPEIGRDVPDESKERHTEIAVDAGRKGGERHGDKH